MILCKRKKNPSIPDLKALQTFLLFSIYVFLLLVNNKCFLTKYQLEASITEQSPCTWCKSTWIFVSSCTKTIHTFSLNLLLFQIKNDNSKKKMRERSMCLSGNRLYQLMEGFQKQSPHSSLGNKMAMSVLCSNKSHGAGQ